MKQYDKEFLKELVEFPHRNVFVKLSLLNIGGELIEEIQGVATGGSINIDGSSSMRRSCNISLISENINFNDQEWVFKRRFKVEIGLENNINPLINEPIIWFPQGIFVINSFNCSLGVNSYSINISGQDKMCLLNGEISGALTAETVFSEYEEVDGKGNVLNKKVLTLREIIWNIVHTYGQEPAANIYIDLPEDSGINLIEYRGDAPLYILRDEDDVIENMTIQGAQRGTTDEGSSIKIEELKSYWTQSGMLDSAPTKGQNFKVGENVYQVQKAAYGDTIGYEKTALVYAGQLIAAAGEAVTGPLDKIRDMLGEYEYFYDVDGVFKFQKKKTYLKTLWNNSDILEIYEDGEYSYSFQNLALFTSFANTPNLKQVKNDYTVWGTRKSIAGTELPIHMRLAIDRKPARYESPWQNKVYSVSDYDWREIIYQMAWDYNKHNQEPDFERKLASVNQNLVGDGRSGYEQYYTDLLGFWRDLYNPNVVTEKNYVKTHFNSSDTKWRHGWEKIGNKNVPYSSWYVEQDGGMIRWIDAVDLLRYEGFTIKDSFIKQGNEYIPFMKTSFDPKVYYFKSFSTGSIGSLRTLYNENEDALGIKFNLNNLYYKDKTGYIKLLQKKEIKDETSFSKLYIMSFNEMVEVDAIGNSEDYLTGNLNDFLNYFTSSAPLYYKVAESQEIKKYNSYTEKFCIDKIVWPEEDAEWYILQNNKYLLYADYLAEHGYIENGQLVYLDESQLYLPNSSISLLEQRALNRDELYCKVQDSATGYVLYKNFFEELSQQPNIVANYDLWYLNTEEFEIVNIQDPPQFETFYKTNLRGESLMDIIYSRPIEYYTLIFDYYVDGQYRYWNKKVVESPETLNFWFDFLDPDAISAIAPYQVGQIGIRNLVKQEKNVKAIYYPEVPEIYFNNNFQIPNIMQKYFVLSSRGQSAFDAVDNYLYNHTYVTESVTINSVPIYHLNPNTKILIDDQEHQIQGEYIIDKMTIPLTYSGLMTINATKAPQNY